jgi:hypothetical protein
MALCPLYGPLSPSWPSAILHSPLSPLWPSTLPKAFYLLYSYLPPLWALWPLYETCYFLTVSRNDDVVSLFRETRFAEMGHLAKQRNKRKDPSCFAE